ncbi:MAG: hypothetical protein A3G71_04565 [Gammaproteobacteria bacterium RIFCSPLOWO2_12_FULL_38_14]|nr:MAG: hypothetical protein A2W47_04195 [Gammaproteobacteria bacterium RIFCSPHIGHO2_12_38_15]OGT75965.1 MAG: hypothetical protein A3G71_04565 [Gammaproteobacteria bacterium RIFCSPLOWO2_12_FULL_38_14]
MLDQLIEKEKPDQEKIALIYDSTHYSYSELSRMSSLIANNLFNHGVKKASRIALFMDNRPELIMLYFAIFRLGAIAVPVNYRYKTDELAYVLNDCRADVLITEKAKEEYVENLQQSIKSNLKIFSISTQKNLPWYDFSFLLNNQTLPHPKQEIIPEDLAIILYTSGSTANPKGVMHSHRSILSAAINLTQTISQRPSAIHAITLPICHIAGMVGQMISTLLVGGKIILLPKFDCKSLIDVILKFEVTHLQMVPVNLVELIDYVSNHPCDLTNLRLVMVGGDKVSEILQEKFFSLSHCYVTEVMGMTESFSYCVNLSHEKTKIGSVGKPAKGVILDLIDENNHIIKNNNEVGEIKILSQANMLGYWEKPEETKAILRDGYVYSGDLAYRDQEGFFWFVGRKKQLIIRGGSNIAPQEVENVLIQHPLIHEVCVVGFTDKKFTQLVCACIVLKNKKSLFTLNDIQLFCKDRLSNYKIPEKIFIFEELPHNTTGKFDRKKIEKMTLSTDDK